MIATWKNPETQDPIDPLDTTTSTSNRFGATSSALKHRVAASSARTATTQASAATLSHVTSKRSRSQTINPPPSGRFHVATTLDEVVNAWNLTHDVYSANGFINPNKHKIHAAPQAVNAKTAVFYSTSGSKVDGTLTAILDGPNGLPLDTVYKKELDALRRTDRRLTEHGMFAHVSQITGFQPTEYFGSQEFTPRQQADHVRTSLIHLMCRTVFFSLAMNCTDIVFGIHPKHVRFYKRAWGTQQEGPERTYAAVNNRPVVLMRLNYSEVLRREELPYAFDFLLNNPIPLDTFHQRYDFDLRNFINSSLPLHTYLRNKYPMWERKIAWFMEKAA